MKVEGCTALVTGAGRGLGKVFVTALLKAGAARVYATERQEPGATGDTRVISVKLDVTSPEDVARLARDCPDVNLLVNNAGIMLSKSMLDEGAADAIRREMDVNVFGLHAMIVAFAPVLAKHGGGGIINMLSVVSWFTAPANATYGASKRAALAVSDAARIELHQQGTQVTGVYAGFIDTEMAMSIDMPKTPPMQVASRAIEGLQNGTDHVLADQRAEQVWNDVRLDPDGFAQKLQQSWDERHR